MGGGGGYSLYLNLYCSQQKVSNQGLAAKKKTTHHKKTTILPFLFPLKILGSASQPSNFCIHWGGDGQSTQSIFVTVQEKTRYKSKTAILDDAHLKVQTLCHFVLKSD